MHFRIPNIQKLKVCLLTISLHYCSLTVHIYLALLLLLLLPFVQCSLHPLCCVCTCHITATRSGMTRRCTMERYTTSYHPLPSMPRWWALIGWTHYSLPTCTTNTAMIFTKCISCVHFLQYFYLIIYTMFILQ